MKYDIGNIKFLFCGSLQQGLISASKSQPPIAQLVERRTVVGFAEILRSLVRIRLEGQLFFSQGLFSPFFELQKNCAPGEARTHDLQITLAIDSL